MRILFLDIKATKKFILGSVLEKLTQRHSRREQVSLDDYDYERCAPTQFLQMQKNQLIDLQEYLERYCKKLPVFGFNSAKTYMIFSQIFLLPILVNEQGIEPTVTKKANQLISLKFSDTRQLNIKNFLMEQHVLIPS